MKKTYSEPIITITKMEVEDYISTSVVLDMTKFGNGENKVFVADVYDF